MMNSIQAGGSIPYEGNEIFASSAPLGAIQPPKSFDTKVDEFVAAKGVPKEKKLARFSKMKNEILHDLKVHGVATLVLAGVSVVVAIASTSAVCLLPGIATIFAGGSALQDCIDLRTTNKAIKRFQS